MQASVLAASVVMSQWERCDLVALPLHPWPMMLDSVVDAIA